MFDSILNTGLLALIAAVGVAAGNALTSPTGIGSTAPVVTARVVQLPAVVVAGKRLATAEGLVVARVVALPAVHVTGRRQTVAEPVRVAAAH